MESEEEKMEHDDEDYDDDRLTDEEGVVVYRCFFRLVIFSVTWYIIFTSDCIYYYS